MAAIPLVVIGLRGRLVGDHKHCRACGFDLHGLDPAATHRCPECGAWLGANPAGAWNREAIRVGRRERRRRALIWGVALGLPSAGWVVLLGAALLGNAGVYEHTPEWLLDWESRAGGRIATRATIELSRRVTAGSLSAAHEQDLVARFLNDQADLSRTWAHTKGDFIGHVQAAARLKPADWERYTFQGVAPALAVRPRVRFEGPVPFSVNTDKLRFGSAGGPAFGSRMAGTASWGVTFWLVAQDASGSVYTLGRDRQESVGSRAGLKDGAGVSTGGHIDVLRKAAAAAVGTAPVTQYGIWMEEGVANLPPAVRPLPSWPAHVIPVSIAPPGEPTVNARPDPRMRELVTQTLHLRLVDSLAKQPPPPDAIEVRRRRILNRGTVEALYIYLAKEATTPWPLPATWSMSVRVAGREMSVGTVSFTAGVGSFAKIRELSVPEGENVFHADAVDVILRPDADAAEKSVGVTEFWDGEIEFKNAPLVRREPPQGE